MVPGEEQTLNVAAGRSRTELDFSRESYQLWKKEMGIEDEHSSSSSTVGVQDEVTVNNKHTEVQKEGSAVSVSRLSLIEK